MEKKQIQRRLSAVKIADAINMMGCTPVSEYARLLSYRWANGELTGAQMKEMLLEHYKKVAQEENEKVTLSQQ